MNVTAAQRRHLPLRSCIICGNKTVKRELLRIVATSEGSVTIDPTGKLSGRGAYLCKDGSCHGSCLSRGPARGRFEYALRTKMIDMQWAELVTSLEGLSTPL